MLILSIEFACAFLRELRVLRANQVNRQDEGLATFACPRRQLPHFAARSKLLRLASGRRRCATEWNWPDLSLSNLSGFRLPTAARYSRETAATNPGISQAHKKGGTMRTFLVVLTLCLLGPGLYAAEPATAQTVKPIDGKYVIDVRTEGEWKTGHIDGAILIPHDQIKEKIANYIRDKKAPIVLYCRTGHRAGLALNALKEIGYQNVQNYGGYEDAKRKLHK